MRETLKTDYWRLGHTAIVFYSGDNQAHGVETLLVANPTSGLLTFSPEQAIDYGQKLVTAGSKALSMQRRLEAKEGEDAG